MDPIPTFIVNLEEDHDRLAQMRAQLDRSGFAFRERTGFLGRTLPDVTCLQLTRDPNSVNNKGALGVMLSHITIWERVARLNDPFALILEDDVQLNDIDRLTRADLPDGFDIVFCGDQSAEDGAADSDSPILFMSALEGLAIVDRRRLSIGAYGYLLSPKGARNLLALFDEHFCFSHVDVRMLGYCCDLAELNDARLTSALTGELRAIRNLIQDRPKLDGYATMQPLVVHLGMTSRRAREDAIGLTPSEHHADT